MSADVSACHKFLVLERTEPENLIFPDLRCREVDDVDYIPVVRQGTDFYVYCIYPYRDSEVLKNRSFLVTEKLAVKWEHELPEAES